MNNTREDLKTLSSAEDLLEYFKIDHDKRIVAVNRLHIMKRMHDYLQDYGNLEIFDNIFLYNLYRKVLEKSYSDFEKSSAIEERVFKVHKDRDPKKPAGFRPGCMK